MALRETLSIQRTITQDGSSTSITIDLYKEIQQRAVHAHKLVSVHNPSGAFSSVSIVDETKVQITLTGAGSADNPVNGGFYAVLE